MIARSQRSISTCYLIDVTIAREDVKGLLRQIYGQHIVADAIRIQEFHGWQVVGNQLLTSLWVHEVFRQCFQGVGFKVWIVILTSHEQAAHQEIILLLVDVCLCSFSNNTACTNIIEIVEHLNRISLNVNILIYPLNSLDRLSFQSNVIVVSALYDGQFTLSINHALL